MLNIKTHRFNFQLSYCHTSLFLSNANLQSKLINQKNSRGIITKIKLLKRENLFLYLPVNPLKMITSKNLFRHSIKKYINIRISKIRTGKNIYLAIFKSILLMGTTTLKNIKAKRDCIEYRAELIALSKMNFWRFFKSSLYEKILKSLKFFISPSKFSFSIFDKTLIFFLKTPHSPPA